MTIWRGQKTGKINDSVRQIYLTKEKKSLFLIFLYISIRVFSVIGELLYNFEIVFVKIKVIYDIFNRKEISY